MFDFSSFSLLTIFLVSVGAILAAAEIGRMFGTRFAGEAYVSTLDAAILGLLALMISFTFSMALARFDARRDALLNEADAIGTAALRARMLPAPQDAENLKLFHDYVQIRLDYGSRDLALADAHAAIARSNGLQEALWTRAMAIAAKDNAMVPTGLYIQSLNEMIDDQQKRLTAARTQVPNIVLLALYSIAVIAIGFTGYASGLETLRWRFPVYIMGILVAAVILLIQDIDRSSAGFVTVSQQPMIDTAAAISEYVAEVEKRAPR
jgi:hypothetical protein